MLGYLKNTYEDVLNRYLQMKKNLRQFENRSHPKPCDPAVGTAPFTMLSRSLHLMFRSAMTFLVYRFVTLPVHVGVITEVPWYII
jgi:hypothetical protein